MMKKGFSLAETTIVIAIFILIILTTYSAYFLSQRSYQKGEQIAEITQNGRVILERMTREIRQAREIAEVSEEPGIVFQDGHVSTISEEGFAQGGASLIITLASAASANDDYYKDMYVKIIEGKGIGQTRKIVAYNGTNKKAEVDSDWDTDKIPDATSKYKIDSFYYYIHYYRDDDKNVWREVFTYCFALESSSTCIQENYVSWGDIPPSGQKLLKVVLGQPRVIGEYVTALEFQGSRVIYIFLTLEGRDKSIDLKTKIFGRNL